MQLSCGASSNIYASLENLHSSSQKSVIDQYEHSFRTDMTDQRGLDVIQELSGSTTADDDQNITKREMYDVTEEKYERLQSVTVDGHTYTGYIPPVMRDILAEMPPGLTADEVLRTCADDRATNNESDDEDTEEDSDYMEGETQQPIE